MLYVWVKLVLIFVGSVTNKLQEYCPQSLTQ